MPKAFCMPPEHTPANTSFNHKEIPSLAVSVALLVAYGVLAEYGGHHPDYSVSYWQDLLLASPLCMLFALATFVSRGATIPGALAGFTVAVILRARFGNFILVNLLVVFAITWMATRVGFQRKLAIGMAEKRTGRN